MHNDVDAVADLLAAPKARWALAWLAAAPHSQIPLDPFTAAETPDRATRLFSLRNNPAGLLASVHTAVEDWRYQTHAHQQVPEFDTAAGYRRVAASVRASPAGAWWWAPLDRLAQTWICTEPGLRAAVGLPFTTNYGHHWDATMPASSIMTSPRLPHLPAVELLSDRNQPPARRPRPEDLTAWDVPITPDAKVFEIHSPRDWITLVTRYSTPHSVPRPNLCQSPPIIRDWPHPEQSWTPDWKTVAQDYDGVYLSPVGWLTATSRVLTIPGSPARHTFCDGWPTAGCVWFRLRSGPFTALTDTPLLQFGYGRPVTGAITDLAEPPATPHPWWRRAWRRFRSPHPHP